MHVYFDVIYLKKNTMYIGVSSAFSNIWFIFMVFYFNIEKWNSQGLYYIMLFCKLKTNMQEYM